MRSIANPSWIVAAALGASMIPALADEPKGDLARLQGSWTARVGPDKDIAITLTIKGNAAEITGARPGGEEFKLKGEIKIDDQASPRTIDWGKFLSSRQQEIPPTLGIYKLEGDSWTICDGGPGKERPTRFEEGDEGRPRLVTWARVKDKAVDKPIPGDLARLQGNWTSKGGPNKDIPFSLAIKGNAIEFSGPRPGGDEFRLKGELKLDETASPKTLDWIKLTTRDGNDMRDTLAIYKLDGDTLTVCGGGPGGDRPTRFEAGDGGRPTLTTWTRIKEKGDEKPLPGDLARFQGTWTAQAGADEEVVITMTVKVNAYTARWVRGDGTLVELKGELRVNDKADPRTIDFFHNQTNDGEDLKDNLGIYAFDGDKIKVCVGGAGNERPTEFKKGEDETRHLLVFARKKG